MPVECSGLSQHLDLTIEPTRRQRGRGIGIAQDADEIEGALTQKPLEIDGDPAAGARIQHIAVMDRR